MQANLLLTVYRDCGLLLPDNCRYKNFTMVFFLTFKRVNTVKHSYTALIFIFFNEKFYFIASLWYLPYTLLPNNHTDTNRVYHSENKKSVIFTNFSIEHWQPISDNQCPWVCTTSFWVHKVQWSCIFPAITLCHLKLERRADWFSSDKSMNSYSSNQEDVAELF